MHNPLDQVYESIGFAILVIILVRLSFKLGYKKEFSISLEAKLFLYTVNFALIILPKSLYFTFTELDFLQPLAEGFGWIFYTVSVSAAMWSVAYTFIEWLESESQAQYPRDAEPDL